MLTGIVSPDITGQVAGTFRPGALFLRSIQAFADGLFVIVDPHTTSTVSSIDGQLIPFCAGLDCHAMGRGCLYDFLSQGKSLVFCHFFGFRKVPPDLGIEVDKTDDYSFCVALQSSSDLFKGMEMVFRCVPV